MRKLMCLMLCLPLLLSTALAEEQFDGQVVAGDAVSVTAPFGGTVKSIGLKQGAQVRLKLQAEVCELSLPAPEDEEAVRAALKQALSRRTLMRIREELDAYAPRIGVEYGRVAIRDQKSRWGSCSAKGNLNFNWKLIMAPPEALRYVVIHELCHRIEFNHSPRFWALVRRQMPEYECWKKWLKAHGGELGVE